MPPFKALWWRLLEELPARALAGGRGFRWLAVPPTRAKIRVQIGGLFKEMYFKRVRYEAQTADFMASALRPGDAFLDIGALYGYFTALAASLVGRHGRVYAFEPNRQLLGHLRAMVAKNRFGPRVVLSDIALCDTNADDVPFYLSNVPDNAGISRLAASEADLAAGRFSEKNVIRVATRTLDSLVHEWAIPRLDMVKIDVEGQEARVLTGMAGTLKRSAPRHVICETEADGAVAALMRSHGYAASMLEHKRWDPEGFGNVLFTREATERNGASG